jgi:predicted nucleic acid-binding protein
MLLRREIDRVMAASAVTLVAAFPAERFGCQPLLARAFALVDRIGAHDAFYVVLAESLGCALLTCDDAIRRVAPAGVQMIMVQPTTSH